ncbi:MAG: 4Fe-4S dicluster domain-containing protein [Chloroflexi bacterium]|nr:4Fe-4S dicluster domain-containing protein [Chloroflexota bacterium]
MCLQACPTYLLTGLETESPRGRIHLMDALAKGRIEPTPSVSVHLDRCLGCRACEAACPSGVPYGRLIELAHGELTACAPRSRLRDILLRGVVARPRVLDLVARITSLYERLGIRRLLHATGLVRALPSRLRRLEAMYPPLTRPRYRAPAPPPAPHARVALLLGCVMRVAYGDVHTAAARVLVRFGYEIVDVPDQACCGALHAHAGDRDAARGLARRGIAAFERANVDAIVVDAAGCGAHMRGWGELLADDPAWRERAAAMAANVRDVSEQLAATDLPATLGRLRMRVTYQDACHLAHAQGIRTQPRSLLRRVEGLDLVEMPQADVCCGSAGTYNVTQPAYADALQASKVAAILSTKADAVVSANPGCMLQIASGLKARGSDLPVLHIVEVLDRALAKYASEERGETLGGRSRSAS